MICQPKSIADVTAYATAAVEDANKALTKFAESMKVNPLYAMQWSGSAFAAAAQLDVWTTVQAWAKNATEQQMTWEDVATRIERHATEQGLRDAESSSSPTANLCAESVRRAWVQVRKFMRGDLF